MITWMKHKYAKNKSFGRYQSRHNDGNKRVKRAGAHVDLKGTPTPTTLVVEGRTGKRRWRRT